MIVKQRLLPHVIAGKKKCLLFFVPYGKGEHALEKLDTFFSVVFIKMQDNFHICRSFKPVPGLQELPSQLRAVVNFAVAYQIKIAFFVGNRLFPAVQVDDT